LRLSPGGLTFLGDAFQVPARAGHLGLSSEWPSTPTARGHCRPLIGESSPAWAIMAVDCVGQLGDLALGVHCQLAIQVAVGDGGHHAFGDGRALAGEGWPPSCSRVGRSFQVPETSTFALSAELPFVPPPHGDAGHLAANESS